MGENLAAITYYLPALADRLGRLALHMAAFGENDECIQLLRRVLGVERLSLDSSPGGLSSNAQPGLNSGHRPVISEWEYSEWIDEYLTKLVSYLGDQVLTKVLFPVTRTVLRDDVDPQGDGKILDDESDVWRPAIEEDPQNGPAGSEMYWSVLYGIHVKS